MNYFPHYLNSQRDPKCVRLVKQLGWQGYGLYWALLELLYDTEDCRLEYDVESLAWILHCDENALVFVLCNSGLFVVQDGYFWSERARNVSDSYQCKKEDVSEARRRAAQKRWEKKRASESIQKLVSAFSQFGVSKAQIEKRLQRRIDAITPAQFVRMREIYTSLNDGMSSAEDWFEMEEEPVPDKKPELSNANATATTKALKESLNISSQSTVSETKPSADEPATKGKKKTAGKPELPTDDLRARIVGVKSAEELEPLAKEIEGRTDLADKEREELFHLVDNIAFKFEGSSN